MDLIYSKCENTKENQHRTGRFIIEYAAKNLYNIENSELEIINNKPKFKHSDINFSISHSDCIAAVCFDYSKVGFDIEKIKERDIISISKRMNFKCEENTLEEFYKNWTLYEASYKLQDKVQSCISQIFSDDYVLSVVSNKKQNIKLNIIFLK